MAKLNQTQWTAAAFWVLGLPALCGWAGYGFGWLGAARLPGDPLAWAFVGTAVGATPAFVVATLVFSFSIASALTRR